MLLGHYLCFMCPVHYRTIEGALLRDFLPIQNARRTITEPKTLYSRKELDALLGAICKKDKTFATLCMAAAAINKSIDENHKLDGEQATAEQQLAVWADEPPAGSMIFKGVPFRYSD